MKEPSEEERLNWPDDTIDYVAALESQRDSLLIEAKGYADTIGQIQALADKGLPIVIKGRRYVVAGWRDPATYAAYVDNNADELVQVLCEVVPDEDGDYISIGDHAVGDRFVSIGLRLLDERDEWPWDVAGWNMEQDCFTQARGFRVIGWQPLSPVNPPTPDAMAALAERERLAEQRGFDRAKEQAAQIIKTAYPCETGSKWAAQIRAMEGRE